MFCKFFTTRWPGIISVRRLAFRISAYVSASWLCLGCSLQYNCSYSFNSLITFIVSIAVCEYTEDYSPPTVSRPDENGCNVVLCSADSDHLLYDTIIIHPLLYMSYCIFRFEFSLSLATYLPFHFILATECTSPADWFLVAFVARRNRLHTSQTTAHLTDD